MSGGPRTLLMMKMPFPWAREDGFTIHGLGLRRNSSTKSGKSCGRLYVTGTKSSGPPPWIPHPPRPPAPSRRRSLRYRRTFLTIRSFRVSS